MAERSAKPPRGVQSIETGGRILAALAEARGAVMLRDLAASLGVAAAQLHPYLVSFKAMGMVEQAAGGQYTLGPFALRLGLARLRKQDGYRMTLERIPELAERTGLMISVAVWSHHGPVITYVHDSPTPLHVNVRVGGHYGLTNTATGKVFTAFLPPAQTEPVIEAELAADAKPTSAGARFDKQSFSRAVALARQQGYATTAGIPIPGISAVAAPVFDINAQLLLCVTTIGPSGLIDIAAEGQATRELTAFTQRLSADLGFCPPIPAT